MGFVENLKWWHWVLISLVLGAAIGFVNSNGGDPDPTHTSMSDEVFCERLLTKTPEGNPWISGVVVHPVRTIVAGDHTYQTQLVTFNSYVPADPPRTKASSEACTYMALYPYVPEPRYGADKNKYNYVFPGTTVYTAEDGDTIESIETHFYGKKTPEGRHAIIQANNRFRNAKSAKDYAVQAGTDYFIPWNPSPANPNDRRTVSDFILAANRVIAASPDEFGGKVTFRYTWWENPKYAYVFAMTGAFVVVGVIWPTLLHFLIKFGYGSPKAREEYDLSRFKHVEEAKPAPKVVKESEMQKLRDLEEAMAANLKAGAQPATAAGTAAVVAPPEIKKLAGGGGPAAAPEAAPDEPKEYMGEFYPVVKPHDHKETKH